MAVVIRRNWRNASHCGKGPAWTTRELAADVGVTVQQLAAALRSDPSAPQPREKRHTVAGVQSYYDRAAFTRWWSNRKTAS